MIDGGEALELPRIEPKGRNELDTQAGRYTGISTVGPESAASPPRKFPASPWAASSASRMAVVLPRPPPPGLSATSART